MGPAVTRSPATTKPCRVLIADDHPVVRQGIKEILREAEGILVKGEATTGEEVLSLLRAGEWDLAVLDFHMPGPHGLDLLQQITRAHPKLPVLVISMHPEDQFAVRLLRAGASGYVAKESAPDELVKAVRKVCAGGKYISPALAETLAEGLDRPSGGPPHAHLSDREYQVLLLIGAGHSPTEIAEQLHLSVKTVSTYRARLLQKLNLRTNAQLIRYVILEKLTPES